jgi:hypothetical protein
MFFSRREKKGASWHPLSIPALQSEHRLAPPGKVACQLKLVETWKWVTWFFSTDYHRFRRLPPFPPITTIFHHSCQKLPHGAVRCHGFDGLID